MKVGYGLLLVVLCLVKTPAAAQTGIFEDVTAKAGLTQVGNNWGVAFGDFDGDQLEDIFVSRIRQSNLLYRNMGDGTFEEISNSLGLDIDRRNGMALWGDINNDGFLDLYLAGIEQPNLLFVNQGDGTFLESTESAGVGDLGKTEAVAFTDFNSDGLLDLFVFNRSPKPNAFYENKGGNTFENVISMAGTRGRTNAMGLAFGDYDNDGDQDLYLVYDGKQTNNLFRNNGDGTFTDVADQAGVALRAEGMAPAFGDYNNDGQLDIYITNLSHNVLYRNKGDGTFSDVTHEAGVGDIGMGWGLTWFDYDNDGWQDLYVVNASSFNSPPDPNVLYHNEGDGTFTIANSQDPTNSLLSGFGGACTDINGDGYLDLFVTNQGGSNQLFLNRGGFNHWLMVKLVGTESNRDAIGARVNLTSGTLTQTREVVSANGWVSQNSLTLHFGLAQQTLVRELKVDWPSGLTETFYDVVADQTVTIVEGAGVITTIASAPAVAELPQGFSMSRSFPNPIRANQAGTTVQFSISGATPKWLELTVYNILGQKVSTLVQGLREPGSHSIRWDGRDDFGNQTSKGIYIVRLTSGNISQSRKVLVLR